MEDKEILINDNLKITIKLITDFPKDNPKPFIEIRKFWKGNDNTWRPFIYKCSKCQTWIGAKQHLTIPPRLVGELAVTLMDFGEESQPVVEDEEAPY